MYRVALISMHGCPISPLGNKDSGGMNVYVYQVARELAKLGNKVDVFTRMHDPDDPQTVDIGENARVVHLPAGEYWQTKNDLYGHIPEFLDNLYSFQRSEGVEYDLIHSHYWLSGSVGIELAVQWQVPHFAMFHTLAMSKIQARPGQQETQLRIAVETAIMRSVDALVVSTAEESEDVSRFYRVIPRNVRVIPGGVDLDRFRPINKTAARESLELEERRIILSVGRMEPLKGLDLLLGAMAGIENLDETRLVVVGGQVGQDRELHRLKSIARTLGLADKVTFAGTIPQSKLPMYYSAADVFVMPSHHETFGLAALEAMACATPVIVSRVGGLKTFVDDGRVGYLVSRHCPEPYAQRLDMILSNPGLMEVMGKAAMERAASMGWSQVAGSTLDLYSDIIRHRKVTSNV